MIRPNDIQAGKIGLWMYCLIRNVGEMKWDCFGIHGSSPVFVVASDKFAAVVSEEPMKKYPLVRDYLIAHQKVNELVMQTHRVLPVRFCTMAENKEKIIKEVLLPKAGEFDSKLAEMENKEEYGLRLRWKDLDKVFKDIGETDEKVKTKKEKILSMPESQRRNELIDVGHLVQEAVKRKNEEVAQLMIESLSPLSVSTRENNILGDAMVLNAAFLVEKQKVTTFDGAVEALDAKYGNDLQFKYIGPVPPFNFVEIVIRWEEETEKQEARG